jgi:hypothetical protein
MTSSTDGDRYAGRPFLRLLECFVLWSVGELSDDQSTSLREMTPHLQRTYGATGSWHDVVAAQMGFPTTLPSELRSLWERNKQAARDRGVGISAEEWTRAVVDDNFLDHSR